MRIMSTGEPSASKHKTLLCAHHGWGKTYQYRFYQERYGKGLIISGESGLLSLADVEIDYIPFASWRDFEKIIKELNATALLGAGYNWLGVDSLTEVSDRLQDHLKEEYKDIDNTFLFWEDYKRKMIGACKWLRDLPVHVLMTCLVAEDTDDNGRVNYWPLVTGNKVSKQLPSLFDHVFCGIRTTSGDPEKPVIERRIVSEEVRGWHGKNRDPSNSLKPVEVCDNVVALLDRIDANAEDRKKTSESEEEKVA